MLISTLHSRWFRRIFVLIYLLLSFSTVNASFWCQDEQNSLHLESSPIGKCWIDCDPKEPTLHQEVEPATAQLFWTISEGDCLDSPAFSSALTSSLRTNSPNKVAILDIDSIFPLIGNPDLEVSGSVNQHLSYQLPTTQILAALSTVVLLH